MNYYLIIEVSLKPGHSDPEGEYIQKLLSELNYPVDRTSVSKIYNIQITANSLEKAKVLAEEMCLRLLANPTKDNYTITIREES